jgi:dipeptidyl aminopeptidase/acylaminoacyl peptidase
MPTGNGLWAKAVPESRMLPTAPRVPTGPVIQDAEGRGAPVRTYQDLLQSDYDADLYETLITSQLTFVFFDENGASFTVGKAGQPAMIASVDPSPDGRHFLVDITKRPFSFLVTAGDFPMATEVWSMSGQMEFRVADLPSSERVPIGGVLPGPRSVRWHPEEDATLVWVEALDGGDPKAEVEHRDKVVSLPAPFTGTPKELHRTEHRFSGIRWFEGGSPMVVDEYDRDKQRTMTWFLSGDKATKVWDRSSSDRYGNPGSFLTEANSRGQGVIIVRSGHAYLRGPGSSPEGDRPFLDRFNLATLKTERIFQSRDNYYETVDELLSDDASRLVIASESANEPTNIFIQDSTGRKRLTNFQDPAPVFRTI